MRSALAVFALLSITITTGADAVGAASNTHQTRWLHPKVHAWVVRRAADIQATVGDINLMIEEMTCDPSLYSCTPGSLTENVAVNTPRTVCAPMATDIATVRSDGPMPSQQAQRWWRTALSEASMGCSAITTYVDDYSTNRPSAELAGAQAVADFTAVRTLIQRVEKYSYATH
jgi:hypothetical protein